MIHRADYHGVLLDEATRLGAQLRLNAKVVDIDINTAGKPSVVLESGDLVVADVIVGADGTFLGGDETKTRELMSF